MMQEYWGEKKNPLDFSGPRIDKAIQISDVLTSFHSSFFFFRNILLD